MLFRLALRPAAPSCKIHSIGLSLSQSTSRTFSSSSIPLFARRIPSSSTSTAAIPLRRHPLLLTAGTIAFAAPFITSRTTTYHDTAEFSTTPYSHGRDAKVPLSKDGGRTLNPAAVRQISFGSILGLGLGIVVSAFSRMLVLVFGLGVVAAQYAARRGYNIFPVERFQRYFRNTNLRSAINDNAAFKISFGLMFALTALGDFQS